LRGYAAMLVSAALLNFPAGCRTVEAPSSSGESWNPTEEEESSRPADPVWNALREQKYDLSRPLSLAKLVEIALANNPSTRKAWEGARGAEAAVGQAESRWYPSLTIAGEGAYQKQKFSLRDNSAPDPGTDEFNYGPSLELTFLLLDLGGRSAGVEEAKQALLAANYSFNQAIQDLLLAVEEAYYGFYSSRAGLAAARADVEDSKKALDAARQKFKVGLVSRLDELQAQSSYNDSLYQLEVARGELKTSKATLAESIGLPADTEFEIAEPEKKLPIDLSPEDVTQLIEEGLIRRPDIAALRASLREKEAAVKVISSDLWPVLNIVAGANKKWYSYHDDPEYYEDSYAYSGYLSLEWEIFGGFYDLNRKRAAAAAAAVAREELREAELAASADVWTKYYAFNTAVGKYKFSQALFSSARESYNLALASYDTGLKSILDLLQSQSTLSAARSKLIDSEKDVFIALAELAHATGRLGTAAQVYK
jgi:outer membrane protein